MVEVEVAAWLRIGQKRAPGEARTLDLRIISTALYPTKLQGPRSARAICAIFSTPLHFSQFSGFGICFPTSPLLQATLPTLRTISSKQTHARSD